MPRDTEFAVIEIGMNHPGEIAPLARMARPHVAMVTTVAAAHLEAFDNVAGIAREKASIMDGLSSGGVAILNGDVPTADVLAKAVPDGVTAQWFGTGPHALRLGAVREGDAVLDADVTLNGASETMTLHANGAHFAMNALGALAVADALGADRQASLAGLARWSPVGGRGAREQIAHPDSPDLSILLIDDSYNANPASMAVSLDVLAAAPCAGRRLAFLGDMKELGPQGPDLHAALADHPAMKAIAHIHCIGPLMQALHDALPEARKGLWREEAGAFVDGVPALIQPGDTVLVKGSLSMGLARIVDAIRKIGEAPATSALATQDPS